MIMGRGGGESPPDRSNHLAWTEEKIRADGSTAFKVCWRNPDKPDPKTGKPGRDSEVIEPHDGEKFAKLFEAIITAAGGRRPPEYPDGCAGHRKDPGEMAAAAAPAIPSFEALFKEHLATRRGIAAQKDVDSGRYYKHVHPLIGLDRKSVV